MEEILKGNFKVKKSLEVNEKQESVSEKLKKKALETLGGSMVYMERTKLIWDGKN